MHRKICNKGKTAHNRKHLPVNRFLEVSHAKCWQRRLPALRHTALPVHSVYCLLNHTMLRKSKHKHLQSVQMSSTDMTSCTLATARAARRVRLDSLYTLKTP